MPKRPPSLRLVLGALVLVAAVWPLRVGAQSRVCADEGLGVKLTLPFGWTLERRSPYARILCTITHPDGGRLTLAVQPVAPSVRLEGFVEDNRKAMRRLGMKVELPTPRGPGLEVPVTSKDGKHRLVQYYVRVSDFGYVLTLSARAAELERYRLAYDLTLRKLEIRPDEEATPNQGAAGATGAAGAGPRPAGHAGSSGSAAAPPAGRVR